MTEVSFTKAFLSGLESRPSRLSADHVEDPKTYPSRSAYILPRMSKPMSKRARPSNPGQERSVTVTLRSLRNPPLDLKLTSQALGTPVLDVKAAAAGKVGVPLDRIRLLHRKKPVPDSKVLRDLVGEGEQAVEFSVMVLGGGAPAAPPKIDAGGGGGGPNTTATSSMPAAQGVSGAEVLATDAFWTDLKGFLLQRIRDERQADELFGVFRTAWEERQG